MSFCFSSISRKSVYFVAFARCTSFRRCDVRDLIFHPLPFGRRLGGIESPLYLLERRVQTFEPLVREVPVHIAERHDVLTREIDEVRATHAADADARDVQEIARRRQPGLRDDMPRHDGEPRGGGRRLSQERAAGCTGRRGIGRLRRVCHRWAPEKVCARWTTAANCASTTAAWQCGTRRKDWNQISASDRV